MLLRAHATADGIVRSGRLKKPSLTPNRRVLAAFAAASTVRREAVYASTAGRPRS